MSTPLSREGSAETTEKPDKDVRGHPMWHEELSAAANAISPSVFDASTLKHRAELLRNVKINPESPESWHAYLSLLNKERRRKATEDTAAYMHNTLAALYDRATRVIPVIRNNRHSSVYVDLWLDFAALREEDEEEAYLARETFKYMKRECIGLSFPKFWYAWADFEERQGNSDKADDHRKRARNRESGGTPASTSRPPNPATTRRPLRPPRRANGAATGAIAHSYDPFPDQKLTDSAAKQKTPLSNSGVRENSSFRTNDRSSHSPALHQWTPSTRQYASPLVSSAPSESLVHPTNSDVLDSMTKDYARKHGIPTAELKPASPEDVGLKHKELNTIAPEREALQNGDSISSHERSTQESIRGLKSAQTRPLTRSHHTTSPQQRKSLDDRAFVHAAPSSAPMNESLVRPEISCSPEVLRRSANPTAWKPAPSLLSPHTSPPHEEAMNDLAYKSRTHDHAHVQYREDPPRRERTNISGIAERRRVEFTSSREPNKRSRSDGVNQERQAAPQIEKRNTGTTPMASKAFSATEAYPKRQQPHKLSPPIESSSPANESARYSGSSSSATPAADRERHRNREPLPSRPSPSRAFLSGTTAESYVTVNERKYLILETVGKGGSSKVFKVLSKDMRIMALKRVKVPKNSQSFQQTFDSYANEIALLRKLRGAPNIVQLYDSEVKKSLGLIFLVMEYGDIDLAKRLGGSDRKSPVNHNFRRLYWHQMLEAVHTIHEARIVHGDLKPANFLIVAGSLKLIDFGIAKAIQAEDTTKIVRDTQIGTPNYMSPEALMADREDDDDGSESGEMSDGRSHKSKKYRVGRTSDIWSLGCILHQMVYGRTPFAHIRNVLQKLSCIQDPNHEITFEAVDEPLVIEVLKGCLQRDQTKRMSIPELLKHPYLCFTRDRSAERSALQTGGDPRLLVRNVCEVVEECGYYVVTHTGEKVSPGLRNNVYQQFLDIVSQKVSLAYITTGRTEDGKFAGRDRYMNHRHLTPTTSGLTHQASRSGLTGSRIGTGTKTGERY